MSTKVKLNLAGFRELRKSPEMEAGLRDMARFIASGCGDGYFSDVYQAKTRAIASVYTGTSAAMKDNAKNNTILKAMQS